MELKICPAKRADCDGGSPSGKTYDNPKIPVCAVFGPSPDETILSGVDRLLYTIGARRLQKLLNWPTPSTECLCVKIPTPRSMYSVPKPAIAASSASSTPRSCMKKPGCCRKCCRCKMKCQKDQGRLNAGDNCSHYGSHSARLNDPPLTSHGHPNPKSTGTLKRSFSLCSLACRKIKNKFFSSSGSSDNEKSRWMWARMQSDPEGFQVYEVFNNSNTCSHPSKGSSDVGPVMIFVMLPNGAIVPFETLLSHN